MKCNKPKLSIRKCIRERDHREENTWEKSLWDLSFPPREQEVLLHLCLKGIYLRTGKLQVSVTVVKWVALGWTTGPHQDPLSLLSKMGEENKREIKSLYVEKRQFNKVKAKGYICTKTEKTHKKILFFTSHQQVMLDLWLGLGWLSWLSSSKILPTLSLLVRGECWRYSTDAEEHCSALVLPRSCLCTVFFSTAILPQFNKEGKSFSKDYEKQACGSLKQ